MNQEMQTNSRTLSLSFAKLIYCSVHLRMDPALQTDPALAPLCSCRPFVSPSLQYIAALTISAIIAFGPAVPGCSILVLIGMCFVSTLHVTGLSKAI